MSGIAATPFRMVVARAPYRVSFAGGGTDLPAYYREFGPGAVFNATLDAFIYISICRPFLPQVRLAYSQIEQTEMPEQLQHDILREVILQSKLRNHLEITTTGEIPGGSGLGSSSSLAVGSLLAMHHLLGRTLDPPEMASLACQLEIEILGKPIGKQDQYASAYGGINLMRFHADETVDVLPACVDMDTRLDFQSHFLLFHTGRERRAEELLRAQSQDMTKVAGQRAQMARQAEALCRLFRETRDWKSFGQMLDEGWNWKRSLHPHISFPLVDAWYEKALRAGAWGGKLLGAGQGGFLLVMALPEYHDSIRRMLGYPPEHPFSISMNGAEVLHSASTLSSRC